MYSRLFLKPCGGESSWNTEEEVTKPAKTIELETLKKKKSWERKKNKKRKRTWTKQKDTDLILNNSSPPSLLPLFTQDEMAAWKQAKPVKRTDGSIVIDYITLRCWLVSL